jgi:putative oxidoreductase
MLKKIELVGQSAFLLCIRLYWGWAFVGAGLGKLRNIERPIEYFTKLNIPMPEISAYMVGGIEFLGGALLMVGLLSRPAAALLSCVMLGAYYFSDFEALTSIFSKSDDFIGATPFSFLFASLVVLFFGPGRVSLDAAICWWRRR